MYQLLLGVVVAFENYMVVFVVVNDDDVVVFKFNPIPISPPSTLFCRH